MYHKELPETFFRFINPINIENKLFHNPIHDWVSLSLFEVMTLEGIHWFYSKGIHLYHTGHLFFRIKENCVGSIHNDGNDIEYALNFVIKGHGEMQWLDNVVGTKKETKRHGLDYILYTDVQECDVVDSWSGNIALVNVSKLHRVVTTDSERFCLSLRARSPKTFDEAVKLLYNINDAEC